MTLVTSRLKLYVCTIIKLVEYSLTPQKREGTKTGVCLVYATTPLPHTVAHHIIAQYTTAVGSAVQSDVGAPRETTS